MDAVEFRHVLQTLELPQAQLGRLVHVHPSNVQRWAQGQARVPGAVQVLLLVLLHTDLTYDDLLAFLPA